MAAKLIRFVGAIVVCIAALQLTGRAATPPTILSQPTGGAVDLFGTFTLSVEANGTSPLSYQWKKSDGTPIPGATSATYFANGAGSYSVAVSNTAGTTESALAVVQADDPLIALKPFTIPSATPAGVFPDLRSWNSRPAGAKDFVTVGADGHFQVNGNRIRFFGVDLTGPNNLPTFADAQLHAQRLARFGFNSVRFHWADMDAPWSAEAPSSLIIQDANSSTRFDPFALDRLHYFMAKCAEVGIYANVNLLVARTFRANDGLGADVAKMDWRQQHLLSFFNDEMVQLQKDYATWLLGTPNRHRGYKTLAEDPAVAIVEILNENGLVYGWLHDQLPPLPTVYTAELQRRWIAWLKARYADQAALYHGWYAADEPLGENRLVSVTSPLGADAWSLITGTTNDVPDATTSVTAEYFNGAPCRMVEVTTAGNYADVNLVHKPLTLTAHEAYTLSFWAKVDAPATVHKVKIYAGRAPSYPDLCEPVEVQGTTWKKYSRTFVMRATEDLSRLGFCLGAVVGKTWIADVKLRPGGTVGALPPGVTLAAGNIPALLTNDPAAHAGMREDWIRFLISLETTYWTGMRDHVRSLGFKSAIVGTISRFSPTGSQGVLQGMDTHNYWNYPDLGPKYPNIDVFDWTMEHRAMVNFPRENDYVWGALRQVKGYPNLATEYAHPAPNLYAGEQEFFFPAYAALQDLDGYWVYSYSTKEQNSLSSLWDSLNGMNHLAAIPIAAALFRRDVAPALNEYVRGMTPEREVLEIGRLSGLPQATSLGMPSSLPLVSRIRIAIGEDAADSATPPPRPTGPVYVSDTRELRWDSTNPNAGFFTINTRRTKAFSGFGSRRRVELDGVAITTGVNRLDWCSIGVTLLEGTGFSSTNAGRALIVATGQYANTGWKWRDATHTGLTDWGKAPFLTEIVSGEVELPLPPSRVKVWALSGQGLRGQELPVTNKSGRAAITLGTAGDTLWYEVQISADPATSYAEWRTANFSPTEAAQDAISGPDADPDGAGLTNFTRYAFVLAARGPVVPPVTAGTVVKDGSTYLTLTFNRRAPASGLAYTIESSSNLVTWTPVSRGWYTAHDYSPLTYWDDVAVTSTTRRFLRLRVAASL